MSKIDRLKAIILHSTKRTEETLSRDERLRLITSVGQMIGSPLFREPRAIEREINGIIADTRNLRKRIQNLDPATAADARRRQDDALFGQLTASLEEAVRNDDMVAHAATVEKFSAAMNRPQSEWVDIAALHHLDELERCLAATATRVIAVSPAGQGRPKNRHAHRVASTAAETYQALSGEVPTFWNGGSTPFGDMVRSIFKEVGIKADLRGPIDSALARMRKS